MWAEGRSERELEELDISLGLREDPAQDAIAALRKHQEAMGMTFEDPDEPVPAPPPEDATGGVMGRG